MRLLLLWIGLGLLMGGCLKPLPEREEPDDDATSGDDDDTTPPGDDDDATPADDDDATPADDDDDATPGDDDDTTPSAPCDGQPSYKGPEACTAQNAIPLCAGCQAEQVTPDGCCQSDVLYFCDDINHVVCSIDCASDPLCGWVHNMEYYDCGTDGDPAPGNNPPLECL